MVHDANPGRAALLPPAAGCNDRLILAPKVTARQEGNAHRGEVAGADGIGKGHKGYLKRLITYPYAAYMVANRRHACQGGRAHAGKGPRALEELIVEGTQPMPAISHARGGDLENRDTLALKPEVDILKIS